MSALRALVCFGLREAWRGNEELDGARGAQRVSEGFGAGWRNDFEKGVLRIFSAAATSLASLGTRRCGCIIVVPSSLH